MNDEAERKNLDAEELRDAWPVLTAQERVEGFHALSPGQADEFFLNLPSQDQAQLVRAVPPFEKRLWFRMLAPDDAADLLQEMEPEVRRELVALLDETTRREVTALLAYAEDDAGGLMNTRFARVRPEMSVDEAIRYLRKQARERVETIYYAYVLDSSQKLQGVVSFRELFAASPNESVQQVMQTDIVAVPEDMDQELVSHLFARHRLLAVPVVDPEGRMKGIVTIDDIVDVVEEEATEDVQKLGGMEALDATYLQTGFLPMVRKRAGWLAILFVGEMLTASAMGSYKNEIAQAVVLAVFIPLIISSGGNSGSQASTLIIRAMALGEVRLRDWWRIVRRELAAGLSLGVILAVIGAARIFTWQLLFQSYGEHYVLVLIAVALSLVGVVTWGTLAGSMLPFVLRAFQLDPASASAPFVATLVDVSGLVIYFTVSRVVLSGTLL